MRVLVRMIKQFRRGGMAAREAADFFYKVKEGKGTTPPSSTFLRSQSPIGFRGGAAAQRSLLFGGGADARLVDIGSQSPGFEHVYTSTCEPPI